MNWLYLVDPGYRGESEPPPGAVVGGWLLGADGAVGEFQPNPDYRPGPGSPTDPVDAALHRLGEGDLAAEALFAVLRTGRFGLAVDEREEPVIAPAPDGVASLLVATAVAHRERVGAAGWREVSLAELALLLAESGLEVLFNPGADNSMRLTGVAVLRAAGH